VVWLELPAGRTDLYLDDLEFGPIVAPAVQSQAPPRYREPQQRSTRAVIGDDQLLIDGRPGMVLFTPYQGEEVDALAQMYFNVIWIDRYDDTPLLGALEAAGLNAMANPLPQQITLEEAIQPEIGLVSFSEQTS